MVNKRTEEKQNSLPYIRMSGHKIFLGVMTPVPHSQ